jgi:hypothetical protein
LCSPSYPAYHCLQVDNRYQNADKKQSANHSKEETFHLNAGGDESSISFASAKQIITTTKQILQEFKNTEWGTADNDQIKELEVRLSSLNEDMEISISTSGIDTVAQDSVARSVQGDFSEQQLYRNPSRTSQQSRVIDLHLYRQPTHLIRQV